MLKFNQPNSVFIIAAVVAIIVTFLSFSKRETFDGCPVPAEQVVDRVVDFGYDRHGFTRYSDVEGFVPWNSQNVGKFQVSTVKADQLNLEEHFNILVSQDAGKIDTRSAGTFRSQPVIREQARAFINHILARINRQTDRRFHILDVQTTYKEAAIDARDKGIINRYKTELFIQEKDKRKVSAHAFNIRMVFLTKDGELQIEELHFITDYFYKRPLVDGYNPTQKNTISSSNSSDSSNFGVEYFRIKNPFHLNQPFFTSEDKVLPPDNKQESILAHHQQDLIKPKYRCFEGSGDTQGSANKEECDLRDGYWDKPVTRDEECPFFMANKNYPNRLGGVDPNGNRCEMPIGTKRIGYRFISADPAHKPWCYGCRIGKNGDPGGIGPCCDEQLNKDLYPNLASPDFAFNSDTLERGQFWKELSERGINWQRHPTNIRDVTNPRQKQPVFNAIIGPGGGKIDLPN